MTMIDPEQERRRLAEFYSGQMDGQLEKVASQAYELTDLALEALHAEMEKRGLTANFADQPPVIVKRTKEEPLPEPGDPPTDPLPLETPLANEVEFRKLVTIRVFRDLPQALLAKGSLESAGIECMLADDNVVRLDWFYSNAVGGIKVLVDEREERKRNRSSISRYRSIWTLPAWVTSNNRNVRNAGP